MRTPEVSSSCGREVLHRDSGHSHSSGPTRKVADGTARGKARPTSRTAQRHGQSGLPVGYESSVRPRKRRTLSADRSQISASLGGVEPDRVPLAQRLSTACGLLSGHGHECRARWFAELLKLTERSVRRKPSSRPLGRDEGRISPATPPAGTRHIPLPPGGLTMISVELLVVIVVSQTCCPGARRTAHELSRGRTGELREAAPRRLRLGLQIGGEDRGGHRVRERRIRSVPARLSGPIRPRSATDRSPTVGERPGVLRSALFGCAELPRQAVGPVGIEPSTRGVRVRQDMRERSCFSRSTRRCDPSKPTGRHRVAVSIAVRSAAASDPPRRRTYANLSASYPG